MLRPQTYLAGARTLRTRLTAIARPPEARQAHDFALHHLLSQSRAENETAIRRQCHTVPLADDVVLCRVLGHYKMFVDGLDHGLSPHLMLDGFWEIWVTEMVMRFLRPGMAALDIGANLGYYTMLFAGIVGPRGSVLAFEPNPRMATLLARSVSINGFSRTVTLQTDPVSDQAGQRVALHVPAGLPQNGALVAAETGTMTTTTVDAAIGDSPVDFIKIDVEGSELAVWGGMRRLLARARPLVMVLEFTPDRYSDPRGFLDAILAQKFAISLVQTDGTLAPVGVDGVLQAGPAHEDRTLLLAR